MHLGRVWPSILLMLAHGRAADAVAAASLETVNAILAIHGSLLAEDGPLEAALTVTPRRVCLRPAPVAASAEPPGLTVPKRCANESGRRALCATQSNARPKVPLRHVDSAPPR